MVPSSAFLVSGGRGGRAVGVDARGRFSSVPGDRAALSPTESQDRGSPLPAAPPARRGFARADVPDKQSPGQGWGKGQRTHLRGLCRLRADKGEPRAQAAGHPSPSERGSWAFRASQEDASRGGLRAQGRSPGATWRRRWGRFCPEVGGGRS